MAYVPSLSLLFAFFLISFLSAAQKVWHSIKISIKASCPSSDMPIFILKVSEEGLTHCYECTGSALVLNQKHDKSFQRVFLMRFPSQESGRSDLKLISTKQLLPRLSHLTHWESIRLHLQTHSRGQRGVSKTPCQGKAFKPIRSHLHSITAHVTGNPIRRHLVV